VTARAGSQPALLCLPIILAAVLQAAAQIVEPDLSHALLAGQMRQNVIFRLHRTS
jgi:hypothetical protein